MNIYIIVENVDLGYHIHSVWDSEEKAEHAVEILTQAYKITYPAQEYKYKYQALEWSVRTL